MSEGEKSLLEVRDLAVTFETSRGPVEALHGVSIDVRRGETVAVVGESGSGKSTLAASVNRLLASNGTITAGSVRLDGTELTDLPERAMIAVRGSRIGMVPQDPMTGLNPTMTVGAQIAEALEVHGLASGQAARTRAVELLAAAGIADADSRFRQYPHEFSGGMRQRVLIAMALACRPELLIADEPTSALDVTVQRLVLDQMAALADELGSAVLLITHDLALAAERADRIVVMHSGRVVEEGPSRRVIDAPQEDYTKRLLAAAPSLATPMVSAEPVAAQRDRKSTAVLLSLGGVTKRYHVRGRREPLVAVDDVSIEVCRGRTVAIVGESGSGKSTTARMALRLEDADSGSVSFEGTDVSRRRGRSLQGFRRSVQPVFQNPYASLDPRYTVGRSIAEPLRVHGIGDEATRRHTVEGLLAKVALSTDLADRLPHELSGGQRQRVAIARALALEPDLVVLDEAVSALDVLVQQQILELMVTLQRELDLAYLFISHDLAVVRLVAHEVHVMQHGRVVESGDPREVFADPQHEYTKRLVAAVPRARRAGPQA
ncbi:dipeptide ABC transporter ATP-binding protein [Knoellia koreensis]|uniref:Glutathione import ATP-binding protein GsiA n=1 Tax=Knoellia koreensis TaxID=2730921 RepID=A0A849HMW2_9MICO|nr:ABC transporter ATP-binding protein [Knoellia sp. DB2414S]